MNRFVFATLAGLLLAAPAFAASATNGDAEARTLIVTEGDGRSELTLNPGETVDFCPSGCFVTMPNGDRVALTGSETVEIRGGSGNVK